MTLFNYWHYIMLVIIFLVFAAGVVAALKHENKKLHIPMVFSISLISLFLAVLSVIVVDKYTKEVQLYNLKNKRLLNTEQILYTGVVKNEGKHTIGEVIFEIKIVNKGHATGDIKPGSFYSPSGFLDFFSGADVLYKPQSITKEFVVAKNLKAGQSEQFRVYFDYPPYFRNASQYESVRGY